MSTKLLVFDLQTLKLAFVIDVFPNSFTNFERTVVSQNTLEPLHVSNGFNNLIPL